MFSPRPPPKSATGWCRVAARRIRSGSDPTYGDLEPQLLHELSPRGLVHSTSRVQEILPRGADAAAGHDAFLLRGNRVFCHGKANEGSSGVRDAGRAAFQARATVVRWTTIARTGWP